MQSTASQSFTPDNKLELLFSSDLIPDSVRDALPAELHVRFPCTQTTCL
jgi:hypothetical protein